MAFTVSVFFFSLMSITGLFVIKEWENSRGRTFVPRFRARIDEWAYRLSELVKALQKDVEKLPPEIVHVSRLIVHEMALAVAGFLRFLSGRAHHLADLVSHKHTFRRRAPRSEFLKKVSEGKNGSSVDTKR